MLRAVLWDFGGVLTTSPFEAFNRYEQQHGLPRDFIRTINATNPETNAWAKFEASQVSIDEFDELFREESGAAGHPVGGKDVMDLLHGQIRPRMVEVLKVCKQQFQVACITNNMTLGEANQPDQALIDAQLEVMNLFDIVIESSIEGVRKPNPRIYEIACNRLDVSPAQCVFLDDLGINLKPARALGMTTIKVTSEAQAISELGEATGLNLPAASGP